jgi:hypothetical protein
VALRLLFQAFVDEWMNLEEVSDETFWLAGAFGMRRLDVGCAGPG